MTNQFIHKHILRPFAGSWISGGLLLLFWTICFISLPAISGWFLAASSLSFITANTLFAYLVPSSIIRFMTLLRTASRYFERIKNHETTLNAQLKLQLNIFRSVARMPFFQKQVNQNSTILENSTHGIDLILNHILLWLLPFTALVVALLIYGIFIAFFSVPMSLELLISSAVLLFLVPQFIFIKNKLAYSKLKLTRETSNQALIQSFRGRIEIEKYELSPIAIDQFDKHMNEIDGFEEQIQNNSFTLQLLVGLGISIVSVAIFWMAKAQSVDASVAIGLFFGMMAQAELAEMLFAGKSEKSAVSHQIDDLDAILTETENKYTQANNHESLEELTLSNFSAAVPETSVKTSQVDLTIQRGQWIALYGETGKGKTTLLNSLFYPEYKLSGSIKWNKPANEITCLPVPQCIYVSQKAYLLTGTLRDNFEGYEEKQILDILNLVDLSLWFESLPQGLDSWIGENGETLSGGQRKKLLLAQALLKNPQLLVVDEPTAGISTDNAIEIFEKIRKHNPQMTILMATHLLNFESVVDKVIRI